MSIVKANWKGSNTDVFFQLSDNCLNTRDIVSVLQNLKVGTELQKPRKQNFPKITLQSMDNIWGAVNPDKSGLFKGCSS